MVFFSRLLRRQLKVHHVEKCPAPAHPRQKAPERVFRRAFESAPANFPLANHFKKSIVTRHGVFVTIAWHQLQGPPYNGGRKGPRLSERSEFRGPGRRDAHAGHGASGPSHPHHTGRGGFRSIAKVVAVSAPPPEPWRSPRQRRGGFT